MRASGTRRSLLISSVAGVAALAMASTAYACTTYKGKVTLTASGGGVATAEGIDGFHAYCSGDTRQNIAIAGTFRLDVAPGPTCGTRLADGGYNVKWLNLTANELGNIGPTNCNGPAVLMGKIQVGGGSGSGSGTFVLPQVAGGPAPIGHVNICVESDGGGTAFRDGAPELYLNLI